jgi:hypothetical protein
MTFTTLPTPVHVHHAPRISHAPLAASDALSTPITQKVNEIVEQRLSGTLAVNALNSISNVAPASLAEIHARRSDIGGALAALGSADCSVMTKTLLREALITLRQAADQSVNTSRNAAPACAPSSRFKPPVPSRPAALAGGRLPKPAAPAVAPASLLGILETLESHGAVVPKTLDNLTLTIARTHGLMLPGQGADPNSIESLTSALTEVNAVTTAAAVAGIQDLEVRRQVSDTLCTIGDSLKDEINVLKSSTGTHADRVLIAFEAWFAEHAAGEDEWEIINGISNFILEKASIVINEAVEA